MAEYNSSGTLVSTFGSSGVALTADGDSANGNAIVVDGNSIWVAAGSEYNRTAVLVQYSSSGAFDQLVRSAVANNAYWSTMAVSGTNVLVAGVAGSGTLALAEYNQYGSPVMSFGSSGVVLVNIDGNFSTANAVLVSGSSIWVAGSTNNNTAVLARYSLNGSLAAIYTTTAAYSWNAITLAGSNILVAGVSLLHSVYVGLIAMLASIPLVLTATILIWRRASARPA